MNEPVSLSVNTDEFKRVLNVWKQNTSQEMATAINRRMFYVLVRAFAILPPKHLDAERAKIRAYLTKQKLRLAPQVRFVIINGKIYHYGLTKPQIAANKILNARLGRAGAKGLYGAEMESRTRSFVAKSIASAGYMKSAVAKAIKKVNGHFKQFGKTKRVKSESGNTVIVRYGGNSALRDISKLYGGGSGNVSMHRGTGAQYMKAIEGKRTEAQCLMTIGLGNTSGLTPGGTREAKVGAYYREAFSRAFADELEEMKAHLADVLDECANRAVLTSPNGKPD